jgi:hypothetical protein
MGAANIEVASKQEKAASTTSHYFAPEWELHGLERQNCCYGSDERLSRNEAHRKKNTIWALVGGHLVKLEE